MNSALPFRIRNAARIARHGGIIAYPTEAVYGLGCDPMNPDSVMRLLALKRRSPGKGLILLAADFGQLRPFVRALPEERMAAVLATWPGPVTWLFPAAADTPWWLTGDHDTLAIRVTRHPLAASLCRALDGPLVSTSANVATHRPARSALDVRCRLPAGIDALVHGPTNPDARPTPIFDAISGVQIRK